MLFALVKEPESLTYYGYVPNVPHKTDETAEVYLLSDEDKLLLNKDFVDGINTICNSLLDDGDVDYFDTTKCALMEKWLSDRLMKPCEPRLAELYTKLMEYAVKAVKIGTGVVIEL